MGSRDLPYTAALRALRDRPEEAAYVESSRATGTFMREWSIFQRQVRLDDLGLAREEVAYLNVVRCRTRSDRAPSRRMLATCTDRHLARWLALLAPRAVVFLGEWARKHAARLFEAHLPYATINRSRSRTKNEREADRVAVRTLVETTRPGPSPL